MTDDRFQEVENENATEEDRSWANAIATVKTRKEYLENFKEYLRAFSTAETIPF